MFAGKFLKISKNFISHFLTRELRSRIIGCQSQVKLCIHLSYKLYLTICNLSKSLEKEGMYTHADNFAITEKPGS